MPYYIETRALPSGSWVEISAHAPKYRSRREADRRVRMYEKVKADYGINCEFRVVTTQGTSEVVG